jgi:diguanylate cyclase (GGDEF)-like protein
VAHIDLDDFKQINDAHGHAFGDAVLTHFASAWSQHLRPGDVLARIGGDEFVLLLVNCDPERARQILARLCRAASEVPCSVGLAVWDGSERHQGLLARADELLYQAKAHGRNCVVTQSLPEEQLPELVEPGEGGRAPRPCGPPA